MTSFSRQNPLKSKNKEKRIFWNTEFYHPAKSELKRIKNAKLVPSLQLFACVLAQRGTPPKKGKAVTFALDWDDRYDEVLCQLCRTQMQTIIMANFLAGVGPLLPRIHLGPSLNSRHIMDWRMERQAPFLKSVLREANHHKRQELLRMANADQINAISELGMNTLRSTVPRSRQTITLLKPHAQSLRAVAKPAHSVKRRRAIMMSLWSELHRCYKRCLR